MKQEPAPIPTMKEVVWALYRAMTDTKMSLDRLWLCKYNSQWRFWGKVEKYLNHHLYELYMLKNQDQESIERGWLRRFIINNWEELAPQLDALFEFGPVNLVLNKRVPLAKTGPEKSKDQTEPSLQVVNNEAA